MSESHIKFEALGSQVRLRIIDMLYKKPMTNIDIAKRLDMDRTGIALHLNRLEKAGFIARQKKHTLPLYYIADNNLAKIIEAGYEKKEELTLKDWGLDELV